MASASALAQICIDSLPNELLSQIMSFLDSPAPTDSRLHDQPLDGMLSSEVKHLKTASLVSKRWRTAVLPLLFHHVVWKLDGLDLLLAEKDEDPAATVPIMRFITDNNLGNAVHSFTMIVDSAHSGSVSLRRLLQGGQSSVTTSSLPFSTWRDQLGNRLGKDTFYCEDNNWLWDMLFDVIDPLRFTIIASPRVLTSLLSRMLFLGDSWGFAMPYHILSLSRKQRSGIPPPTNTGDNKGKGKVKSPEWPRPEDSSQHKCVGPRSWVPCNIFTIRPWTALLLNEGSSIKVYRTYEYFLLKPPSILGALLGAEEFPNNEPLIPTTVKELAYVGIFPLTGHFAVLVNNLPRIDKLFVQLVPRNGILDDREEMNRVDPQDLWMERNTSYSILIREMLEPGVPQWISDTANPTSSRNWAQLREFESGDAADRKTWEMAVQYVRMTGSNWRVAGEGVFVKRGEGEEEDDDNYVASEEHEEHEEFNASDNFHQHPADLHTHPPYMDYESPSDSEDEEAHGPVFQDG